MISIFGENLSTPPITANFDDKAFFPTSLGNSQVTFNGVLAPLLYVSNTQINAIVPYEVANANTVDIVVLRQIDKSSPLITVPSAAWTLPLVATVPGIFTTSQTGSGPGAILNVNATTGQTTPNSSANPAKRGSAITLFATGSGVWNPAQPTGQILIFPQGLTDNLTPSRSIPGIIPRLPVSLTIGGRPATLLYAAGAPDLAGILQLNVIVPTEVASGPQPIDLKIGTASSSTEQQVTVFVE